MRVAVIFILVFKTNMKLYNEALWPSKSGLVTALRRTLQKQEAIQDTARLTAHGLVASELVSGLIADMQSALRALRSDMKARPVATLYGRRLATCIDLLMYHHLNTATIPLLRLDRKKRALWPDKPGLGSRKGIRLFTSLLLAQVKTAHSVKMLCLLQCPYQARALMRTYQEMSDVILAMLSDEEFCKLVIRAPSSPSKAYKFWRSHLAPSKVREVLRRSLGASQRAKAIFKSVTGTQGKRYNWLSNFAHVNPVPTQLEFVSLSARGRKYQDVFCSQVLVELLQCMTEFHCMFDGIIYKKHYFLGPTAKRSIENWARGNAIGELALETMVVAQQPKLRKIVARKGLRALVRASSKTRRKVTK